MKIKRLIEIFLKNKKIYDKLIEIDYIANVGFRGTNGRLDKIFLNSYEWKLVCCYRKFQVNKYNLWGILYKKKLYRMSLKTGVDFADNYNIGKGLIIGHWGKIVLNKDVVFGDLIMLTHGVTIGRDVRGNRKGVPTIGNRVCIRANSTIVGKITIGNDVLIAPNTFVNFNVPDHSIVVGNPAKIHYRKNATEGHMPDICFKK